MSNQDHLKATQTLYLPIFSQALLIEQQFNELLKPPPVGIYKINDINPCIVPSKKYFSNANDKKNGFKYTPIVDFNSITDTVFDENGFVVLHANIMRDKTRYLTNSPTVPSRGLSLIELLVKRHIELFSPVSRYSTHDSKILALIKPECGNLFTDGHLDLITESIINQVNDFIGNDTWHIYFVKLSSIDLLIEKTIDFRIQMWEEEHGHKYRR